MFAIQRILLLIFFIITSIVTEATPWKTKPHIETFIWTPDKVLSDSIEYWLPQQSREGRSWRLPHTTYPIHYHLNITFNLSDRSLTGNCSVDINVQQDTQELVLHALFIKVISIRVENLEIPNSLRDIRYTQFSDLLIITTAPSSHKQLFLQGEKLRVSIAYTAHIWMGNTGMHLITDGDANDPKIFGAATHMQPINARTVLPCYDEPGFRAFFTVTITHNCLYTVLSNMAVEYSGRRSRRCTTRFLTTPQMSTYLLAIVLIKSRKVESYEFKDNRVLHRVFKPLTNRPNHHPALNYYVRALNFFEEYLGQPYSLQKLDSFIYEQERTDISIEGMENWGLIIYNAKDLEESSRANRLQIVYLQCHEIVHQWFGNLVTPAWWTHLWLSEGFAQYYAGLLVNELESNFGALEYFDDALCYDVLSHGEKPESDTKLATYDEPAAELKFIFNAFVYKRAPCIIRMFDHALGQDVFHRGIVKYLKDNIYSTVESNDLYAALQAAMNAHNSDTRKIQNFTIAELMNPWVFTKNFPLLIVKRYYDPENAHLVRICQMSMNYLQQPDNATTSFWWIPLNFATKSQPDFQQTKADFYMPPMPEVVIDMRVLNISLNVDDWLIVDKRAMYFYHVVYDDENMKRLNQQLDSNPELIHARNRRKILHSLYEWCSRYWLESDQHELNVSITKRLIDLLKFIEYLPNEKELLVWSIISRAPMNWLVSEELWSEYTKLISQLLSKQFESYRNRNVEEFSVYERTVLPDFVKLACVVGLPACRSEAREFLLQDLSSTAKQNGQTGNKIIGLMDLCHLMGAGGDNLSDSNFERALTACLEAEDGDIRGLFLTNNITQFERLLQWMITVKADDGEDVCSLKMAYVAFALKVRNSKQLQLVEKYVDEQLLPVAETIPCFMTFCDVLSNILGVINTNVWEKKRVLEVINFCETYRINQNLTDVKTFLVDEEVVGGQYEKILKNLNVEYILRWLKSTNKKLLQVEQTEHAPKTAVLSISFKRTPNQRPQLNISYTTNRRN